jgi:gluconate 2-dehydrogenase alpha chain
VVSAAGPANLTAEHRPGCDVVLVGLGATGGAAAEMLTGQGAEVVAIEAGPRLDAVRWVPDELHASVHNWLAEPKAAHEEPTWRGSTDEAAAPSPRSLVMMNGVGGASVHYEALSARLCPWNFEVRTAVERRYGPGAIPAGSTVADWPFGYDELEPFYGRAEHLLGVAGLAAGQSGPDGLTGDPFEGRRAGPYPMPPMRPHGWGRAASAAARRLGWHPFPAPAAINSVPHDGRPACTYCGFCTGHGCYIGAKNSADVTFVRRAERTGRLRIETMARALRIETDGRGLASGVTYLQAGRAFFQPARVVLVGTFVFENVRLLLTSASRAFPAGLANNSGQVGKHFIAHLTPQVWGWFPGWDLNLLNGQWEQGASCNDLNADNFDHAGLGFISGGMISAYPEAKPISLASGGVPPWIRQWGTEWKAWLREHGRSVTPVSAQLDALPYEDNALDLDPARADPAGVPVIRITHRLHDNEKRAYAFLQEQMGRWLREAGAARTWAPPAIRVEGRHAYGGTRMGEDPQTSVVDPWGFCHEVPNLGMLGASTFPTAGGVNPTLTAQAVALRTAGHLAARI